MSDLLNHVRAPLNSEAVHHLLHAADEAMSRHAIQEEYTASAAHQLPDLP